MSITRRLFLRNTAAAGAAGVTVAPVGAAPLRTPREQAIWHMQQLERLVIESGAHGTMIAITGFRVHGSSSRSIIFQTGDDLWDEQGLFAAQGGDA